MRAWDSWNSYLDDEGHLFHGKVEFCIKGTTTRTNAYDYQGNQLSNPIYTDALGRTRSQVFVDDDVTAIYWKYIGNGNMETDADPSNWDDIYTSVSVDPISSLHITADSIKSVSTMASLRSLDPNTVAEVDGKKYVLSLGYYKAGDAPSAIYIWDATSTATDDAGSVIKYNQVSVGRWLLCPTGELHFDVRHFGVMPTTDIYSTDASYTSQLTNCARYANKCGLDLFFPQLNNELSYYLFDGTNTCDLLGDIYISPLVRFHAKTGTTGTLIKCDNIHKPGFYLHDTSQQTGQITINARYLNASWLSSGVAVATGAYYGYIIDTIDRRLTYRDCTVDVLVPPAAGTTFDNCQITSHHKIENDVIMYRCEVKDEWFSDDYDYRDLLIADCVILLDNFKDVNTYLRLKTKQNDPNYGNLGERNISPNFPLLAGGTIENCYGSATLQQGNYELHNVSLTLTTSTSTNLNAVDSWLTFTSGSQLGPNTQIRRGMLACSSELTIVGPLSLFDVDVTAQLKVLGVLNMSGGTIHAQLTCPEPHLNNVAVNANVCQYWSSNVITFEIIGCRFANNCFHILQRANGSTVTNAVVTGGVWCNNFSLNTTTNPISHDTNFVVLDRTGLNPSEVAHDYTYRQNSGLPKDSGAQYIIEDIQHSTAAKQIQNYSSATSANAVCYYFTVADGMLLCTIGHPLSCRVFTIGTENLSFFVTVSLHSPRISCSDNQKYNLDALMPNRTFWLSTFVQPEDGFSQLIPNPNSSSIYSWAIGWGYLGDYTTNCLGFNVATSPTKISRVIDLINEYAITFHLSVENGSKYSQG